MTRNDYIMAGILGVQVSREVPFGDGVRACVTGGRDFDDLGFVWSHLDVIHHFDTIIEIGFGCARGVDRLAWQWAKHNGVPWRRYLADWDDGRKAGTIRNGVMLRDFHPDTLCVFPGGPGTTNCAKQAREMGIDRQFFNPSDDVFDEAKRWG